MSNQASPKPEHGVPILDILSKFYNNEYIGEDYMGPSIPAEGIPNIEPGDEYVDSRGVVVVSARKYGRRERL